MRILIAVLAFACATLAQAQSFPTRPVTIVFEENGSAKDPYGNLRVGFEGGTTINRTDWGLSFNAALETGGVLVSEKIKLEFDVSAIKSAV